MTDAEKIAYLRSVAEQRHWLEPFRSSFLDVCDLAEKWLAYEAQMLSDMTEDAEQAGQDISEMPVKAERHWLDGWEYGI